MTWARWLLKAIAKMYARDELPTRPYPALAPRTTEAALHIGDVGQVEAYDTQQDAAPGLSELTTTLCLGAKRAYTLFGDSERLPEWMAVVRSSRIISRFEDGRAKRTAFIANLERASMGYTLEYRYDDASLRIEWTTAHEASTVIAGSARFQALSERACMMHYKLDLRLSPSLPGWGDPMYNGHPASSVLSDFREFASRHRE